MPELIDVLIVGAGPTGLTLAAQLRMAGVRFRIVDRLTDRVRESRAFGVQARTLEIFDQLGIAEALVARGRTAIRVRIHVDDGVPVEIRLADIDAPDTRFPFVLFVSQMETEAGLTGHLEANGVAIERGVELLDVRGWARERSRSSSRDVAAGAARPETRDGAADAARRAAHDDDACACTLRLADGREEVVRARYVVGCDGAHSLVRRLAAIPFEGEVYPQDFLLADVEVDGLQPTDAIHPFLRGHGIANFFPLGHPRSWRVVAMTARGSGATADAPVSLAELQAIVGAATSEPLRLRDAAWITRFRLHHRQARHYRVGRLFIAGDAAHIHSPMGAQGMNAGIQDAWNLGWKLALVARGQAPDALLDTYHAERWPVGRFLLRFTDRYFSLVTRAAAGGAFTHWARRMLVRHGLARIVHSRRLRTIVFRIISELDVRYRSSPAVREGEPRLQSGPRAGDRLPDLRVSRDGEGVPLQRALFAPRAAPPQPALSQLAVPDAEAAAAPHARHAVPPPATPLASPFHLLICGESAAWRDNPVLSDYASGTAPLVRVHRLTTQSIPGALIDDTGDALRKLGVRDARQPGGALYLIRPDGHVAYRCAGHDLRGVCAYLAEWCPRPLGPP